MKFVRSLTLGAALALGATAAVAQPPAAPNTPQESPRAGADARRAHPGQRAQGPRGQRGRAEMIGRGPLFQGIELSEAQRTQLRAVGERHRERLLALRPQGRTRADSATRPDSAARVQRRTQMMAMQRQFTTEVRGVLTPAQQQTYDANRVRMTERLEARAQRDGRGGDGDRRGRMRAGPPRGR